MYESRIPLWLLVGAGVGVGTGDGSNGGSDGSETDGDGGSELELGDADDPDHEDDEDDPDGADQLGDAGKRALDEMKSKWKSERQKRIAAEAALAENSTGDDEDAKARQQTESAAIAKANARIVKAEVRAAAAGKLADPADALNFIDLGEFEVGEDGDVDQDEIADAIDDLLRRKPYLAAQGGTKGPKPDRSQGAKGKGVGSAAQQFAAAIDKLL